MWRKSVKNLKWDNIADQHIDIYKKILNANKEKKGIRTITPKKTQ